jgi:hypothetical protein
MIIIFTLSPNFLIYEKINRRRRTRLYTPKLLRKKEVIKKYIYF